MSTTQDGRMLKITTPLGKDFLLIDKFKASEEISQLFTFEAELLHWEGNTDYAPTVIDEKSLLGQSVMVEIEQRDEKTKRTFCGIINEFVQGARNDNFSFYKAKIVPKAWLLTQIKQSRIFQHKSVKDILSEVLSGAGIDISMELETSYKPRNYCVQYNETDFDFVSRLMEEEGIFYYFRHGDNKHTMIIADTPKPIRTARAKAISPIF